MYINRSRKKKFDYHWYIRLADVNNLTILILGFIIASFSIELTYVSAQNMWRIAIQIFYAMSFDCVLPYEYTWFETLMNMFSLVLKCAAGSSMFVCVYKRLLTHSLFSAHFLSCLNFFCHCWLLFFILTSRIIIIILRISIYEHWKKLLNA